MLNVGNPLAYGLDTVMDLQGRLRDVERVGPSTRRSLSLSSWHAQLFLSRLFVSWQRSLTEVAVRRALKKNKNKREEEQEEVC